MSEYLQVAEGLWRGWLESRTSLSDDAESLFDSEFLPEPYLDFGSGANPLVILTTNPGGGLTEQLRESVVAGRSPARPGMTYAEVAQRLAEFYTNHLKGSAQRRITAQHQLARGSDFTGVLQVEMCPWHSPALPNKRRFVRILQDDRELKRYSSALRDHLNGKSVVNVSAVSSAAQLTADRFEPSEWLRFQAEFLGLEQSSSRITPLVWKGDKVTGALWYTAVGSTFRGMVLMMGSNNFPGRAGLEAMAETIRTSA